MTPRITDSGLRAVADELPSLVFVANAEGEAIYFNRKFQDLTGLAQAALIGDAWLLTVHEEDRAPVDAAWRQAIAAEEPYEVEYRLRAADGHYHWFLVRCVPVATDGRVDHWVGVGIDIHDRKLSAVNASVELERTQDALAASHADLEQRVADRTDELIQAHERLLRETKHREALQGALLQSQKLEALGRLAARVAYDFNTVMTAIDGGFDMILAMAEAPELRKLATEGTHAAHRGRDLVRKLLEFARRQNSAPSRVELKTTFDAWAPELRLIAGSRVELMIGDSRSLPAVQIDPCHLRIAMTNLVVNARDAMPGHGRVNIDFQHIPCDHPDKPRELDGAAAVAIHVTDNGLGMSVMVLQRALEPFYTTKIPSEGAGLGLPMVHGLMMQSGGALRLRSVVGRGTTVSLFIPLSAPTATANLEAIQGELHGRAEHGEALVEHEDLFRGASDASLDRLAVRVSCPVLYRMLANWRRARQGAALPSLSRVAVSAEEIDFVAHVAVDQTRVPMTFELKNVGAELVRRAETDFTWWRLDVTGDKAETSREGVYGRCVRSRKPTYDYARFDFGQEGGSFFRRLLLPCSEDGLNVTSLIVVVNFDETTPANEA